MCPDGRLRTKRFDSGSTAFIHDVYKGGVHWLVTADRMAIQNSADARAALMAAYIRRMNPQAGEASAPKGTQKGRRSRKGFGARGRTIYNAKRRRAKVAREENTTLKELARIDAEEAARGARWTGREEEEMVVDAKEEPSASELAAADELFGLYIHI